MENLKRLINYLPQLAWLTLPGNRQSFLNNHWLEYTGSNTHDWTDAVHPDFKNEAVDSWEFSLQNSQPFETDCLLRRYDNEYRWHRITAAPVENFTMGSDFWIAICVDINELILAQKAAEENKLFLENIAGTSPDIIYVFDNIRQQVLFRNRQRPDWPSPEELASMQEKAALKYVDRDVLEHILEYCHGWNNASSDEVREIEYRLKTPGRPTSVKSRSRIFMLDGPEGLFIITGLLQDCSHTNQSLDELIQSEKTLATGHFARIIAHEIRNPLTNVNLALDGIKQEALHLIGRSDSILKYLEIISRNTDRIKYLIEDILYSVGPAGEEKTIVSIADVVEDALEMLNDRILLKNIPVKKDFRDKCDIQVYQKSLQVAFKNIILNAIEALDKVGEKKLTIVIENRDRTCCIVVKDNGHGIPDEVKDKIFEPFFSTKPSGVGIGLTNSQSIIHNCGGTIEFESESGKGTKFIICFPIA